jgi:hypothetical protein
MNIDQVVKLLQDVASRGFSSEPQTHWLNKDEQVQYVTFEDEEKREIRKFLGKNQYLAKLGKHPIPAFFGDRESTTISLMGRITYAMDGRHIGPEYVADLAVELEEVKDHSLYQVNELNRMMKG